MCEPIYENWLKRFIHQGDNVFYRMNGLIQVEPIAWNQALMACDGLDYLAECFEILGETAKAAEYDRIVNDNLEFYKNDSWTVQSDKGTTCLQWRYSKVADKVKHAEDLNHASLVANVFYNLYINGRHKEIVDPLIEQMANTMFDIVFSHERNEKGQFPGRINGVYDGQYCDGYVRDDHVQLADIRKDWYEKVLEINSSKYQGSLSMTGRFLWNKTRRIPAPSGITAVMSSDDSATLTWQYTGEGTVTILYSPDLLTWEEIAEVPAAQNAYTHTVSARKTRNYRLVARYGGKAGYSSLVSVSR